MKVQVISFYKFYNLAEVSLASAEAALYAVGERINALADRDLTVRGLCIMGVEGVNATFSVDTEWADKLKSELVKFLGTNEVVFKDSFAEKHVFHDFKIKIRKEIVSLSRPDLVPGEKNHRHLSPAEWHKVMSNEDIVLVDTRNSYEYDIGHFKGAVDPKTREFNEFPEWVKQSGLPKNQKVLIYCTGGIRCEKAILDMEEQGYQNVYQLEGGILNYLKEYPDGHWNGECFVFDYRVAVDTHLQPSKSYKLCPHCGQPGKVVVDCVQCKVQDVVCEACLEKGQNETGDIMRNQYRTCSKNCAHHFRLGHKTTRIHHDAFNRRVITTRSSP